MVEINLLSWRDNSKEKKWRILFIISIFCSLVFCVLIFKWMKQSLHQAQFTIHYLQEELKEKADKKARHPNRASVAINIPLSQIKLAGYMEKNNFFWGLVMLPNGETREIQVGTVIGKENGLVLKLNKNEMVIQLENGEVTQIT